MHPEFIINSDIYLTATTIQHLTRQLNSYTFCPWISYCRLLPAPPAPGHIEIRSPSVERYLSKTKA